MEGWEMSMLFSKWKVEIILRVRSGMKSVKNLSKCLFENFPKQRPFKGMYVKYSYVKCISFFIVNLLWNQKLVINIRFDEKPVDISLWENRIFKKYLAAHLFNPLLPNVSISCPLENTKLFHQPFIFLCTQGYKMGTLSSNGQFLLIWPEMD